MRRRQARRRAQTPPHKDSVVSNPECRQLCGRGETKHDGVAGQLVSWTAASRAWADPAWTGSQKIPPRDRLGCFGRTQACLVVCMLCEAGRRNAP